MYWAPVPAPTKEVRETLDAIPQRPLVGQRPPPPCPEVVARNYERAKRAMEYEDERLYRLRDWSKFRYTSQEERAAACVFLSGGRKKDALERYRSVVVNRVWSRLNEMDLWWRTNDALMERAVTQMEQILPEPSPAA